ncbi:uncharacterized protein N0V89_006534 [Didymosphaeria variabile]|uniref:Nephrocystin 3-like N-terminal domain-containing protein n=1 Tax=Didymosphaeria variabile TaxID=1932322 RepID=A0A9W8XH95_9PLEO|nr:uncharacterized protein N0V89_006534 [Didymosphaeria variabile]KAJ4351195.1 hypothetical protein N0V89_006534 [Didymosphaeria variabile]
MADPLSVAASIAGLASLGDLLFRKLIHYVQSVKGAEKEVVDLKNEIALLTGVLHNLGLVARDLEADSTVSYTIRPEHVSSCLALLHRLDDELGKIGIKGPGKISKHLQKLAWPFKNIKVREYIEDIRKQRDTLNAALNADSFNALLQCLSVQKDLSKHIRSVETLLRQRENIDTRIKLDEERESILDYFLFVDPQPGFQTSVRLRCATTGFWLTEDETFCQWNNSSCNILWMSGIPGAGKTVLSGLVIQGCMAKASENRAVAFFYCDYKNPATQKPMHVLACLASQIARQSEVSFQVLKDYYSRLKPRDQLKKEPEASELLGIIREMSSSFEDVRIVVDGLDECGENAGSLTENLLSLCDTSGCKTYLALLSRNETDIGTAIERRDYRHIEIAAKSKDLDHFVRSEMEIRISTGKLHLRTSKIKDEIIHELVTRAAGMFRWVSCQLDHLCELPTDKERRRALQKLPATLHESYERLLLRLQSPPIISLVQKSLRWIAYASPPLTLERLLDVLSLNEEELRLDDEDRPDPDYIYKYCGSLIRKGQDHPELAHFTVLEYLEAIDPEDSRLKRFRLSVEDRSILTSTCASYLSASNFDRPSLAMIDQKGLNRFNNQHPFHGYAALKNPLRYISSDDDDDMKLFSHFTRLFHPRLSFNVYMMILQHGSFNSLEGYDVNEESPLGGPLECAIFGCGDTDDYDPDDNGEYSRGTIINSLIHRGNATAPSQRQPVEVMMDNGFIEAVKFAVQFNHADRFEDLTRDHRFTSDEIDVTILAHLAAANDAAGTLRVLMTLYPDVIMKTNDNGETSWHIYK